MNVEFKCRACGGGSKNEFRDINDFSISAYDDVVQWSNCTDEIPHINENNWWELSDITPKPEEYRVVCVSHPFNESLHGVFWTLFMPSLSSMNGWEDFPEEIDSSAFVQCKLEKILTYGEEKAWLQVKVTRTIMLSEVTDVLPEVVESLPIVENTYKFDYFDRENLRDWLYYNGGAQGDLGHWMLVKEINGEARLIAFGEWSFHQNCAYLGNILLSNKTFKTLNSWCRNL